jgi:hypothetical protein
MQIVKFDRANIEVFQSRLDVKMKELATEFGIALKGRVASFTGTGTTFSLEASVTDATGASMLTKSKWESYCVMWGLDKGDLGRTFVAQRQLFEITDCNPNAPRFPILAKRPDGKVFKFPIDSVKRGLAAGKPTPSIGSLSLMR